MKTTIRFIAAGLLAAMVLATAGCNTMAGIGKDVERAGEKVQEVVRDARK